MEVFLIVSQRYHRQERIILGFLGIITICFIIELFIVKPDWLGCRYLILHNLGGSIRRLPGSMS